ncbi:hypothetical protein [Goodfellowiella coeruleoviolacea]|uniref:Prenyltransferase-like n=1 Tax=Goodfellowiella coeruleoviolacea TaxID=334858 RepID=A0AAE3KE04_9PSEU|nr:hypothetical protein [Goodfellowiella coeruleoviolacea]MCP2163372.1 Prenyltransferase-like [Goodfellowiella coeruleoviolacea]
MSGRFRALTLLAAALLLGVVASTGTATAARDQSAASAAARWLATRLSPEGTYADPRGGALPDHGLMIDALFAMYATNNAALAAPIVSYLDDQGHASDYFTWDGLVPGMGYDAIIVGGAAAKTLLAAEVSGRDPRNFDGTDMVAETTAAIMRSGPDRGRVSNYSKNPDLAGVVSNEANVFGQALAVIGLAVAGANDRLAIDTLLTQQCAEGYFRIFFTYIPTTEVGEHVTPAGQKVSTCEEGKAFGKSAPDGDTTGIALSALLAAREAGATGLDEPIARTTAWLTGHQDAGGGWGGGVNTEAPNTNSTGLITQALADAGGADAAVARGVAYLKSAQVTTADAGTALAGEVGAVALNPASYQAARTGGIVGVDTWIRAGAQAALGLAQVGFADLARHRLPPDQPPPPDTTVPSAPATPSGTAGTTTPAPVPPATTPPARRAGNPAPPPGSPPGRVRTPATPVAQPSAPTPAGRLGAYLAGAFVDGDHVEVTQDGATYVDYDATAEAVLALRTLGEQPEAVQRATHFLLRPESIDAYAHGVPYEQADAAYAEPLAKLQLIARFARADAGAPADLPGTTGRLAAELAALRTEDGRFVDTGSFADTGQTTRRQAWAIAATVAAGDARNARVAAERLLGVRCADGTFPVDLRTEDCPTGELAATAAAVTALNLREPSAGQTGDTAPADWPPQRAAALTDAARALTARTDGDGLVPGADGQPDIGLSSTAAAGRQALGLDTSATARSLGALLLPGGGLGAPGGDADFATSLAAAPGLAGRSWINADNSPVAAAVRLPLAEAIAAQPVSQPAGAARAMPWWATTALGGVAVAVALGFALHRVRARKASRPRTWG